MSRENVKKFYELVKEDNLLAKELLEIDKTTNMDKVDAKKFEQMVNSKIVPLARERGLDFTADELIDYVNERYSYLSDEDLLAVSGGLSTRNTALGLSAVLLLSLGTTAAVNVLTPKKELSQVISGSPSKETDKREKTVAKKDKSNLNEEKDATDKNKKLNKNGNAKLKSKKLELPHMKTANNDKNGRTQATDLGTTTVAKEEKSAAKGVNQDKIMQKLNKDQKDNKQDGQKASVTEIESVNAAGGVEQEKKQVANNYVAVSGSVGDKRRSILNYLKKIKENSTDKNDPLKELENVKGIRALKKDVEVVSQSTEDILSKFNKKLEQGKVLNSKDEKKYDYFKGDVKPELEEANKKIDEIKKSKTDYESVQGRLKSRVIEATEMAKFIEDNKIKKLEQIHPDDRDMFKSDLKQLNDCISKEGQNYMVKRVWGSEAVDKKIAESIINFYNALNNAK